MTSYTKPSPALTALWYRALESEFGIELTVTHMEQTIADLYASRKAANDPRLEVVQVARMKDGTVWLVKREMKMEDGDAPALT